MARSDLYLYDPLPGDPSHWRPATSADLGGGAAGATAANQALSIAALQSLDMDNATEAQQIAIANAIASMEAALLAEDQSTAANQALQIAKAELIRLLLVDIEANQDINTAEVTKIFDAFGFDANNPLDVAIGLLATEAKQDSIVAKNEAIRALIADLIVEQGLNTVEITNATATLTSDITVNTLEITKLYDALGYNSNPNFKLSDRLIAIEAILAHLGTAADTSIDFDQTGSISQRLRGIQTELASLSGENILNVIDLTGFDGGTQATPVPIRSNYAVVQAENVDPELLRIRPNRQVAGSVGIGVDRIFDLIERQWVPYVVNRNPHLVPIYGQSSTLNIIPALGAGSEAANLNVSVVFAAKDTPSGLLTEDVNARSANVNFSADLISSNVLSGLQPKNRKQYKYAIFKFNAAFNPIAVRPRQVSGSSLISKDRIYDITLGQWVREMTNAGHAYAVPLYAAPNLTIFNVDGGSQAAGFVGQVVFTNSNINTTESSPTAGRVIHAAQVVTGDTEFLALAGDTRVFNLTIQNKSDTDVLYWNTEDPLQPLVFTASNTFELPPKGIVNLAGLPAKQDLYVLAEAGVTVNYLLSIETSDAN